ncbi:MAG: TetR/AcrR family transcriptional regulator [Beijerinckiaceae bacterium]
MSNLDTIPQQTDRKNRILDAAERCFVRNGFHKSTMQDVAAECGMSPGNLYRYFPSKDAIVAGLAERDREQFNADFERLARSDNPLATFVGLGRQHLVDEPRSKAVMMLEIWAESARNPQMAMMCAGMDAQVQSCMAAFVAMARERSGASGVGTPEEVARLILALADGLMRRRATDAAFEPEQAFQLALPVISLMIGVDLSAAAGLPAAALMTSEAP